jgi:hypothetical protein
MKPSKRLAVLLALLAGSAALVLFSPPPKGSGTVVPVTARAAARAQAPARGDLPAGGAAAGESAPMMILPIRPRVKAAAPADAFALNNWNPPPPPPPAVKPGPPPKPTAPPLPFTLLGKKLEDGNWQVFLSRQDRTYVVRAQDVIDGAYRVESIAPPNLVFTYIPLNERQVLAIGGID